MPLYDFKCDQCGQVEEHLVGCAERDDVNVLCPACKVRMRRCMPYSGMTVMKSQRVLTGWRKGIWSGGITK